MKTKYSSIKSGYVLAGWLAIAVASASAAQVGINFVRPVPDAGNVSTANATLLAPTDQAGAPGFVQGNWNNFNRWGSGIAPLDASGAATTLTVNWDATGTYGQARNDTTNATQATPDGNLMNGYLDSNGSTANALNSPVDGFASTNNNCKPWVYVQGINAWLAAQSASHFDVVVYSDGDATSGRGGRYWLQSATGPWGSMTLGADLTTQTFVCDRSNYVTTTTFVMVPSTVRSAQAAQRGNWQGNYIVFQSLTNDSFLLRQDEFNSRSPINAVQIIPHSTPVAATIDPLGPLTVYAGKTARIAASVGGALPMTFQWRKNGVNLTDGGNISGATTVTLTLTGVSAAADNGTYTLVVNNPNGPAISADAVLTVVSPAAGSYAEKIVTGSPFAYWRLNDTTDFMTGYALAADSVGGFNGVYGSAAVNGYFGTVGPQPPDFPGFDASNFALQAAYNVRYSWITAPPLNLNTNTVTVCAWIYPTTSQASSTGILSARGSGSDVQVFGYANNGYNMLGYNWLNQAATYNYVSGLVPPSNQWSFVALVVSPTNAILYLCNTNDQASATNTLTHASSTFGGLSLIGCDPSDATNPQNRAFAGSIDEVAVFNRCLTPTEVNDLYKKGLNITALRPAIPQQPHSLALMEGRTARFSIRATGDAPLSYRWRKGTTDLSDGGRISGALTPTLTISGVTMADAADYAVNVSNGAGNTLSTAANLSVVVSNTTPVAYEKALRDANPIAYWRFGELSGTYAHDYWGGNIALHSNVTVGVAGPRSPQFVGLEGDNAASSYDGVSSATIDGSSLINNRPQFSIIGWFCPTNVQPARTGLFGQNDCAEFGFHGIETSTGQAQLAIWTPGGGTAAMSQTNVIPGAWHLVAGVGDGTTLYLYLISTNGVRQASVAGVTTNYGSSPFPFKIGGGGILDATGNQFWGEIDEVAVFDRALSVGDLSTLFGAAMNGGALAPIITVEPASRTVYTGQTVRFPVSVLGSVQLYYQWRKDGLPIGNSNNVSGAFTPTLTITAATAANNGTYDMIVTNFVGGVTSAPAVLTTIPAPAGSYAAAVIAARALAYYSLDEMQDPSTGTAVAYDYLGGFNGLYGTAALNGFNGILGPQPPDFTFPVGNRAVSVTSNTPNSFVTAPIGSLSTNAVTFTMWIKPTGGFDPYAGLLVNRNAGVAGGFGFTGGQVGYTWNNNNSATYNFRSGFIPPLNEWTFVAGVIQPNQAVIYMSSPTGLLAATNVLDHTLDVFGNNWQIGNDNNDNANTGVRAFNGQIDEVAVFLYSMNRQQLEELYSHGGPLPVFLTIQGVGSNVVLTWPRGTLLETSDLSTPWITNNAASPFTNSPTGGQKFYKVIVK